MELTSSAKKFEWSFSDVNLFKRSLLESAKRLAEKKTTESVPKIYDSGSGGSCPDWVIEQEISVFMMKVGVMPKYAGFSYLRSAIAFILKCGKLQPMTTRVYPHVGGIHDVKPGSVERDIRHALKIAHDSEKLIALNSIVGDGCVTVNQPMTNGEFVATVSEFFFWQLKNIEYDK